MSLRAADAEVTWNIHEWELIGKPPYNR